jgi:hypothetical protein
MAMTKAEQQRVANLEKALAAARALHWPTYAEPAPMTREEIEAAKVPGGNKYGSPQMVAFGFSANSYDKGSVGPMCSDGIHSGYGSERVTSTQGMGRMYRTEAEAWRVVRLELTRHYAQRLAEIDAMIEDRTT